MSATSIDARTSSTEIVLVRHGETAWNRIDRLQGSTDIPLNPIGYAQATLAASALAREPWDAIVSGPLQRAMQTAHPIAALTGLPIDTDADLTERSFGDAEGLLLDERLRRWPDRQWPGIEPIEQVRVRAHRALASIAEQHPGGRVIVVSHGGLLNAILSVISGGTVGTGITRLGNLSFSRIRHRDGRWEILGINDVAHLANGIMMGDETGTPALVQPEKPISAKASH